MMEREAAWRNRNDDSRLEDPRMGRISRQVGNCTRAIVVDKEDGLKDDPLKRGFEGQCGVQGTGHEGDGLGR